jgi:outer membrane protein TolC
VWLAFQPAVLAQSPQPGGLDLTLEDAVRLGVERAPRLAEARARETAAESGVTALRALGWPVANASMQYLRLNHVDEFRIPDGTGGSRVLFPDIPNAYKARVEVSVPLLTFGRVSTNVAAADADVHGARADRRALEADVRLDVMRAYWTLATARESVDVLVQSLARTDAWVGDVRSRVDVGLLPPNDVLSAQAQRARQYVRLLQARNDASMAELDLARLVGAPAGTSIRTTSPIDRPLPQSSEAAAVPVADLVSRAVRERAEREGLTARGEGLRQAAKASLANLKPYLVALASVEPSRPNPRFVPPVDAWRTAWTVDLKMMFPIFDGGRSKAQAAGLDAQAQALDARRDEFDGLVGLEVRQRVLEIEFGRAALVASAEAIAAAAEARRVVEERFRAGVATSTEVLDAQILLLEAELERTRLNAGLRLGEARLLRAIGSR